jgi:hypothetical protein
VEKMQFIFFVPPNEELEGTLHPQKFGCTHKNEGKRAHVPPDEKTCGHTASHIILYMNKIDVGYKKGPVPYIKLYGTGPFLYPTSILLIKRQAPVV